MLDYDVKPKLINQIVETDQTLGETDQGPERLDCFAELERLERQHIALDYIHDQYYQPELDSKTRALAPIISPRHGVEQLNNQFARRVLPAFMHDSAKEGLRLFRSIEPHTTDEELALLIHDGEFFDIHEGLAAHLARHSTAIADTVNERLSSKGQISWNDRYQFNGIESKRSLDKIERQGIIASLDPQCVDQVTTAYEAVKYTQLPMTEFLKNMRIVQINGFKDSKVSHIVHDAMDHTWGFQLLRETGLDQKYADFFASIGDPMHTDMFKREGEIISSIGFGVRYGSTQENGFIPFFTHSDLGDILDDHLAHGRLRERHMEAYKIIRTMSPNSREALSLGFTYSNYVTELDEQRRKHGKIKVRDAATGQVTGELSETDPDFLSLFIELHHAILSSKHKHRDNLFRFHILLEEYFQSIATKEIEPDQAFLVRIQDLDKYDYSQTSLSADKLKWMFKHYGFAATKGSLI